jgi:hypothetical protein
VLGCKTGAVLRDLGRLAVVIPVVRGLTDLVDLRRVEVDEILVFPSKNGGFGLRLHRLVGFQVELQQILFYFWLRSWLSDESFPGLVRLDGQDGLFGLYQWLEGGFAVLVYLVSSQGVGLVGILDVAAFDVLFVDVAADIMVGGAPLGFPAWWWRYFS